MGPRRSLPHPSMVGPWTEQQVTQEDWGKFCFPNFTQWTVSSRHGVLPLGKKSPNPEATSSRKQFLLLLWGEQGLFSYLCLWSHTMCAPILELKARRELRELGVCLCQGSWLCHWPHRNREETLWELGIQHVVFFWQGKNYTLFQITVFSIKFY